MAIFDIGSSKNKGKQKSSPVSNAVENAKDTNETQKKIADSRVTREEVEAAFSELQKDPDIAAASRKAAAKNDEKLKALWDSVQAMRTAYGDEQDVKMSRLWDLEKDIFIVPGGYPELPTKDNGVPKNNLDVYACAIEALEREYKRKTVSDAVSTGADRLDPFLFEFLGNLRNAMETGHAMKANACLEMIRYILTVGYRFEDAADPEKFDQRVQDKVDFLKKTGRHMIEAIDYYYNLLSKYELEEQNYARCMEEYDRQIAPYFEECPDEVKETLDHLGFKRSMTELPNNSLARKYLGILLSSRNYLSRALLSSLRVEAFSMRLLDERSNLQELAFECQKAFAQTGGDFNYEKHMRIIEEIQRRNVEEVNRLNDLVVKQQEHNEQLEALVKEALENERLASSAANAKIAVESYERQKVKNEALKRKEAAKRIETEKARQRVEEYREQLNEQESQAQIIEEI